jgi:hypothetical protein
LSQKKVALPGSPGATLGCAFTPAPTPGCTRTTKKPGARARFLLKSELDQPRSLRAARTERFFIGAVLLVLE